jgi:hypothetical protein
VSDTGEVTRFAREPKPDAAMDWEKMKDGLMKVVLLFFCA